MNPTTPEIITRDGASLAIYRDGPAWNGAPTATLGQFTCPTAEAGAALITEACATLSAEGIRAIIGPMDGDTWHRYRLVSETDGSRPFLMEPTSGPHDFTAFERAGFAPISRYLSSRTSLAEAIGNGPAATMDGIAITAWDGANAEAFLEKLFAMSSASFAGNAFYKPISRQAFLALYQPVMPMLDPRLILFAFDEKANLAGFLFAIPDHLEGAKPRSVILKTYASMRRGVGHLLADSLHRRARDLGFDTVIHALMHENNISRTRSGQHGAAVFRRYALMGRILP